MCPVVQYLARIRERHRSGIAHKQSRSKAVFKSLELLGHCGRVDPEGVTGSPQRAAARNRQEGSQAVKIGTVHCVFFLIILIRLYSILTQTKHGMICVHDE